MKNDEQYEHKIIHMHESKDKDNPEIYRILTITGMNYTIDLRSTFKEEDFEHLIGVYEKVMNKIKEAEKDE